jgi:hypothetical protein
MADSWVAGALCRSAQSSVRQLDRERREGIPSARSGVCGLHPLRARARQLVGRMGGRSVDQLVGVGDESMMYSVCIYMYIYC